MAPKQQPRRKYKKQTSLTVVKLISGILAGKTKKQAALDAGLSRKNPKYASQAAHLALSRAIERTPDLMDKHGLTTDSLIENELIPLLHATQIKVFQHHGKVKSAVEVADNVTRKDALDMAFRLHGAYAPLQVEQQHKQTVSCIVLDVPRPKRDIPPPTMVRLAEPKGGNGKGNGNGNQQAGKKREPTLRRF
jgi:hypothetical protein